ncbi:hypothetical protein ACFLXO_08470 [Chloroflexota bacterium]
MEIRLALLQEGVNRLLEGGACLGGRELLPLTPVYGHDVALTKVLPGEIRYFSGQLKKGEILDFEERPARRYSPRKRRKYR